MNKIALCFLTYDNLSQPKLWSEIINNNKDKLNVYIHNKTDFVDNTYELHKFCIPNKIATKYAHKSLIEATLELFRTAYNADPLNRFFILLSDKCIPLHNFDFIYKQVFELNSNIIFSILSDNNPYGSMERYKYIKDKNFIKKKQFMKDSQWILLNRDTVSFFINHNYLHLYSDNFVAADEHYFGTFCNKFQIPFINKSITFVNWREESDNKEDIPLPKTYTNLTDNMIENIKQNGTFFLRKVSSECILPPYFDSIT